MRQETCIKLGVSATLALVCAAFAQPANDLCANATPAAVGSNALDNTGATTDVTGSCGGGGVADVWYSFSPPATGGYIVDTCGSGFDTVLGIYDACGGTELACIDDFCGLQSRLAVSMTAGTSYRIRVAGFFGATGAGALNIAAAPPAPANDNCAAATVVTVGSSALDNTSATADGTSSCGFGDTNDVWYSFTPAASDNYIIDTCGSSFDTILSVLDSCGGTELACNDQFCGNQSRLVVSLTAGVAYKIRVAGYFAAEGTGTLNIAVAPPAPANDLCANATAIGLGSTAVDNTGAFEDGTASCGFGGSAGFHDVWYSFTAPGAGCFAFDTCSGALDTIVSVFDSCGGTEIACDDDFCGFAAGSSAQAVLTAGQTVRVRVAGWGTADEGATTLTVTQGTVPSNDLCANATVATLGSTPFDNTCSGTEAAASCGFGGDPGAHDVWYSFTAPATQAYNINTCGSFDTQLSVYDTCGGTELACNDDACGLSSSLVLSAVAGTTYKIRVAGWQGTIGSGNLNIVQPLPNDICATATPIALGTTPFDTSAALNDDATNCGGSGPEIFYTFTPTQSGIYQFDTCNGTTGYDSILAVLSDCATEIVCNDDFCGLQSQVIASLTAGQTYIVQIDGFGGASGTGELTISFQGGPLPSYTECSSSTVFASIATTGTQLAIVSDCDDCAEIVPIGFTFNFFGTDYTDCYPSSNGLVSFGAGSGQFGNQPIPTVGGANNFCTALWDDQYPIGAGDVYYQLTGSAPNRALTISWEGVASFPNTTPEYNYQVILHETSNNIEFVYGSITPDVGGDYSIGCENATGNTGTAVNSATIGAGNTARTMVPPGSSCGSQCDDIDFNNDGLFPDTADIDDFIAVFAGLPCPSTGTICNTDIDFNNDGLFPDTLDIDAFISVFSGQGCLL